MKISVNVLVMLFALYGSMDAQAVIFKWAAGFAQCGAPLSVQQFMGCDAPNEAVISSKIKDSALIPIGARNTFIFENGISGQDVGMEAKRVCFASGFGAITCPASGRFNISPNGNYEIFRDETIGCRFECGTPLVLDMKGNGFEFASIGQSVSFDIDANGEIEDIQWVRENGDDVFLALDINGNGVIDDGSELFGSGTSMLQRNDKKAKNGFKALGQYDHQIFGGNGDFKIDKKDKIWQFLLLWNDKNSDGISTKNELLELSRSQVKKVGIVPIRKNIYDEANNWLPLWAKAVLKNGKKIDIVDVFFRIINE